MRGEPAAVNCKEGIGGRSSQCRAAGRAECSKPGRLASQTWVGVGYRALPML